MNPSEISFESMAGKLAGIAGAAISMRFMQGSLKERMTLAVSGAIASYYAAPYLSMKTGMPEGLAGFLLGLFGMAVASKAWEFLQNTPVATLWQVVIDWFKAVPVASFWQIAIERFGKRKKGDE